MRSKETREKISKGLKRAIIEGRFFKEDHKRKISNSKIGVKNAMFGKKRSEETRRKSSLSLKGKKAWNKGLKLPHLSGENAPGWKGGITPINEALRHSLEYRLWRKAVFERDNYICRFCFERGGELEADHIKPFAYYPELRFAIDNGRTLCHECHTKTDTYRRKQNGI